MALIKQGQPVQLNRATYFGANAVKLKLATLCLLPLFGLAEAKPRFTGHDVSGIYACEGDDAIEGKYTGQITFKLIPEHSVGDNGSYFFKLEAPPHGLYIGYAAMQGNAASIYFANTDTSTKDFGTGIATFKKDSNGKWTFKKFYYEPEYKGGNHGYEICKQN